MKMTCYADAGLVGFLLNITTKSKSSSPAIRLYLIKPHNSHLCESTYSPDFLVRTESAIYLVETKGEQQTIHPNVQRKLKAAIAWCERINQLSPEHRDDLTWHYVLLAENTVAEWQSKGARLAELLDFARLRPQADALAQFKLL